MALLDQIRDVGLVRRLARATIDCYQGWVRDYLRFHRDDGAWRHPRELGTAQVESYLTHLARAELNGTRTINHHRSPPGIGTGLAFVSVRGRLGKRWLSGRDRRRRREA